MNNISEHFTYGEVIKSNTAANLHMDNSLPAELLPKVQQLAENILEKVRAHFGKPVQITSWYRCPALNQMISNNPNSQHTKGEAVDFVVKGISNIIAAEYIRDNLTFDQLIIERNWIHCSYISTGNRMKVLRTFDGSYFENGLYPESAKS